MDAIAIDRLSNHQLARLLDLKDASPWDHTDAAEVLRHQLGAPIIEDLAAVPGAEMELEAAKQKMLAAGLRLDQSFQDQLLSHSPLPELLGLMKRFARQVRDQSTSPLRGAPATVLYYAAIACALVKGGQRISQIEDTELKERFGWASRQKGAEQISELFEFAIESLAGNRPARST